MKSEKNNYIKEEDLVEKQVEFARLYAEARGKLVLFVKTSVQDAGVTDDIVHETFLEAWKRFETIREHPNKVGWLYRVAGYKIKEYERQLRKIQELVSIEEQVEEVVQQDTGYLQMEITMDLYQELSEEELLRYRRFFIWGYTIEELAEKENVTVNNMRVRLSRLRKKLDKIKHWIQE